MPAMDNPWESTGFKKRYPFLVQNLAPSNARVHCYAEGLISTQLKNALAHITDNAEHTDKLLGVLSAGNASSFKIFCGIIRSTENEFTFGDVLKEFDALCLVDKQSCNEPCASESEQGLPTEAAQATGTQLQSCDVALASRPALPGQSVDLRAIYMKYSRLSAQAAEALQFFNAMHSSLAKPDAAADARSEPAAVAELASSLNLSLSPDLLAPDRSSEISNEGDIRDLLSRTPVTVYLDEKLCQEVTDHEEIILTTLVKAGFQEDNVKFKRKQRFNRAALIVTSPRGEIRTLIRVAVDISLDEFNGGTIRNIIISDLEDLTGSKGKVEVTYTGDYSSVEVFLLMPVHTAVTLLYTAIFFPGLLAGLGILEINNAASFHIINLRVDQRIPAPLDGAGSLRHQRLREALSGFSDYEGPLGPEQDDLLQWNLLSMTQRHRNDESFFKTLAGFISLEMSESDVFPSTSIGDEATETNRTSQPCQPGSTSPQATDQSSSIASTCSPGRASSAALHSIPAAFAMTGSGVRYSSGVRGSSLLSSYKDGGRSALHASSEHGHIDICKQLLSRGADVNATDADGRSALHASSANGHVDICKLLLSRGADVNGTDKRLRTALHLASAHGKVDVAKLLLSKEADVKRMDSGGDTALHDWSRRGHVDICELLISSGADVNAADNRLSTPLHLASLHGKVDVAKLLVIKGADVKRVNGGGDTALHDSSRRGHVDICELLISSGADVNAANNWLGTPLHLASLLGKVDVAKLLVLKGADVKRVDYRGDTALHDSSRWGYVDICELLISSGADVNAAGNRLSTPLHLASMRGKVDVAKLLVSKDADVKRVDNFGDTALHDSSRWGHVNICELLISSGADVNAANNDLETPLHYVSMFGEVDVAKLLVLKGADVKRVDYSGKTPLQLCSEIGKSKMRQILLSGPVD